jgi:aspartate/methionine/tyrosine aminotransferase
MFSKRTPPDLSPNEFAVESAARGSGPFDLTLSNPTVAGIDYPLDLLDPLADPAGLSYRPDPRGLPEAREAVSAYYVERGASVPPERVFLCASTSEAYGLLFRLLCDPGDAVLAPAPSYPLFDHLGGLEGVRVIPYGLDLDGDGQPLLDDPHIAGSRAVLVVHPNNPTGAHVAPGVAARIAGACGENATALIADEVFLDYPLDGRRRESFAGRDDCLTFVLGGLSKSVGLPQLKLGWIVVSGPDSLRNEALERLEFVSDAYLSASTPAQLALASFLERGKLIRTRILERCMGNLRVMERLLKKAPSIRVLRPEGGWSAVVRYPSLDDDETVALKLMREDGVAVHPGTWFGFPTSGHLVVSLLPVPHVFREGVVRLLARVAAD